MSHVSVSCLLILLIRLLYLSNQVREVLHRKIPFTVTTLYFSNSILTHKIPPHSVNGSLRVFHTLLYGSEDTSQFLLFWWENKTYIFIWLLHWNYHQKINVFNNCQKEWKMCLKREDNYIYKSLQPLRGVG